MELIKSNIHMSRIKDKKVTQITLDDDFIVQDIKPDIDELLANRTNIVIDAIKVLEGKVVVKGKLTYIVLYAGQDPQGLYSMNGTIPFDEVINMDDVNENDMVSVEYTLDDVNVSAINSRKINVRAIVSFMASCEEIYDEDAVVDVNGDANTDYIKKPLEVTKLVVSKKDVYRIKDESEIPSNKPNIEQIVWSSTNIRNLQVKPVTDGISVNGELIVFIMYRPVEEQSPIQWIENVLPFSGLIDVPGIDETMITNIVTKLSSSEPEATKDYDGEARLVRVDAALDMDIKVYEEESIEIVTDIYSPNQDYSKKEKMGSFESLLVHNQSRCKAGERVKIDDENSHVMQVCNAAANIKLDDIEVVDNGISINGVVDANTVYISSNDVSPVKSVNILVPFEYTAEALGIDDNCKYFVRPSIEQLSAVMVSTDEIEIKASIVLDVLVLKQISENVIYDVTEQPVDMEKIKKCRV